jgi:hypothetical protein
MAQFTEFTAELAEKDKGEAEALTSALSAFSAVKTLLPFFFGNISTKIC